MNHLRQRQLECGLLAGLCSALMLLLWAVRRAPLGPVPLLLLDAPGAWFALVGCIGALLATLQQAPRWHGLAFALLIVAAALAATPWVMGLALLLSVAIALGYTPRRIAHMLRSPSAAAPRPWDGGDRILFLASVAVLLAALVLAWRHAGRYDAPDAGAALDGLVFGLTLLAAILPLLPFTQRQSVPAGPFRALLHSIWLFPLLRLFELSPWDTSWSLIAALVGGGLACWAALARLMDVHATGEHVGSRVLPAMALAALGLASSAGVAASCFLVLALVIEYGIQPRGEPLLASSAPEDTPMLPLAHDDRRLPISTLVQCFPLAAPFLAGWLAVGACAAAESPVLAGLLWLALLARGVTYLIDRRPRYVAPWAAAALLAVGVLAPQIITYAIQPVVEQLQGGLTAYGSLNAARWIGLTMVNAASRVVLSTPTLASAALLVVLLALCVLVARLWPQADDDLAVGASLSAASDRDVWRLLVREVPWFSQEHPDADR